MKLAESLQAVAERVKRYDGRSMNEETTKHVLIEPFLEALGWDARNPDEVEFERSTGFRDGRIDIVAMCRPGQSALLVECKAQKEPLDLKYCSQLRSYFTSEARQGKCIGVLTNGVTVKFFADFDNENILDDRPFLEIDFCNFSRKCLPLLELLSKQNWDVAALKEKMRENRLRETIKTCLMDEQQNPSEALVAFIAELCSANAQNSVSAEVVKPLVADVFKSMLPRGMRRMLHIDSEEPEQAASEPDDPQQQKEAERHLLEQYSDEARRIHDALLERLQKETGGFPIWFGKHHGNFKREQKTFLSFIPLKSAVQITVNLPVGIVQLDADIEDISVKHKWGVGNYRVNVRCAEDIDKFMPLFMQAWDAAAPAERQEQGPVCTMH